MTDADVIIAGGGLAGGLIALALAARRPEVRLLVLEAGEAAGGDHTWSFHGTDLDAAGHAMVAPFVARRWPAQVVRFPGFQRRLPADYASATSDLFARHCAGTLGPALRTGAPIAALTPTSVTLASGERLSAGAVIDARGPRRSPHLTCGFQVFLGRELRLAAPHGVDLPVIMDATVGQTGGYRFVYLLPIDATRILVEDTVYTDGPVIDDALFSRRIDAYAAARGWRVLETLRQERGVLPITLGGDIHAFWREAAGQPRAGLAAGLFHPTTGYSLPDAVALAAAVAAADDLSAPALFALIRNHAVRRWRAGGFFRMLNRMLFRAAPPDRRRPMMERFYTLPDPLIERFYAGRPTLADKARILTGRPPVPIGRAIAAIAGRVPAWSAET